MTAHPGDQIQIINASTTSSTSRKSSLLIGSNIANEDENSGYESLGKKYNANDFSEDDKR